ncbi:hypothetical protein RFI_09899 [Reticulomyxa filosa]|uniref:Glycosyl hydrolase family 31 C-terminal domain-containing protein n=1 Tax=Reticulomyxa filosa TaxID=46433 RepID=X6NND5_RETFI|nr:hypothetical protein RFI_09899 [Reticulomyxa filosa]|eukprot:ETO27234.1 hypothetical protein RFI_09899 [Reticulomyxa filosa]
MQDDTGGTPLGPYPKSHINDWPQGTDCWRKFAKLRFQLVYYIYTSAYECHQSGLGMMRHFIVDDKIFDSKDLYAFEQEYEYLFGDKFLVAPVVAEGATFWEVYLPTAYNWYQLEGNWIYNDTDGRFRLVTTDLIKGGTSMLVDTPLDILPLFVKVGTIIPVMDPSVQTLNQPTNSSANIISYYDRINILHLWCFPNENYQANGNLWDGTTFQMYQDSSNNFNPRLDITNLQPPRNIIIVQIAQLTDPVTAVANGLNTSQQLTEVGSWQEVVQITGSESVWAWDAATQVLYVKMINLIMPFFETTFSIFFILIFISSAKHFTIKVAWNEIGNFVQ